MLGVFSAEETAVLTKDVEALTKKMEALKGEDDFKPYRGRPSFEKPPEQLAIELDDMFPYDAISGDFNPLSLPMTFAWEPPRAKGFANFSSLYQGPPRCVHGGFIAAYFDQIMTVANAMNQTFGPTVRLTTKYRKPTPLNEDIVFEAWIDRVENRKIYTNAELYHGDTLTAEAEGLFIQLQVDEINQMLPEEK